MSRFATLHFERALPLPAASAWAAWTSPVARRIWSSPGPKVEIEILSAESGIGGLEVSLCRVAGQPDTRVESRWLELEPQRRSVNSETVAVEGHMLSSALITAEVLSPSPESSLLRLTVQLSANRDGMEEDYIQGFNGGLTSLEALCRRLMVIERLIPAPPAAVWAAWSDPQRLPLWWGPEGFSCRTRCIDLRPGGEWIFDMIGPDGTVYPNHHRYGAFQPQRLLSYSLHQGEDGPLHAEAWAELTPAPEGTLVTLGMIFTSEAECQAAKAFGAEALGLQTLGKLAHAVSPGRERLTR